ncbi:MAG TPA: beta-ketoacyl-[acyl-carrier-protein] synthase family protein [Planctomycetota bacterium]|nr:beta-ketoacyl-[acyl-carrier-protein] synthase family protein [Planctomycetota bacterium]
MSSDDRPSSRRVVVTGLGVLSPIGIGVDAFWSAALAGRVGTGPITQFDASRFRTHHGGEVGDIVGKHVLAARGARATRLAVAASAMCLEDAGLRVDGRASEARIGVCLGTIMGPRPAVEEALARHVEHGGSLRLPLCESDPAEIGRAPARELGLDGPNVTLPGTCTAGNAAIGYGLDAIQDGGVDVMLVGGAEQLSEQVFMMFDGMRALSPDVVRPFDADRRGILLAEGAAVLALERLDRASRRGARIYGEVLGYGSASDAHHLTAPDPEGKGAIRAMESALRSARARPESIDFVNAHGTGTPLNDRMEARAIGHVFRTRSSPVPVTAVKSLIGHTSGAAGAVGSLVALLAIRDGLIPPTANVRVRDPECELDLVTDRPRAVPIRFALNNAFGFGGSNDSLVFGAWDPGSSPA